jgi:hypothetical protein
VGVQKANPGLFKDRNAEFLVGFFREWIPGASVRNWINMFEGIAKEDHSSGQQDARATRVVGRLVVEYMEGRSVNTGGGSAEGGGVEENGGNVEHEEMGAISGALDGK